MKNHDSTLKLLFVLFFTIIATAHPPKVFADVRVSVGFDVFYNDLEPDGSWVQDPSYGYVWIPYVQADFVPYATGGHWVYTNYGWTWVSDYRWGWATFHYGRWYPHPLYGWIWVPGSEWGPAWVVWSSAPGYYGWAPLEPGIDIHVVFGRGGRDRIPADRWIFVSAQDIDQPDLIRRIRPRSENVTIINKTVIINKTNIDRDRNVRYVAGPDPKDVEKKTGKRIQRMNIRENDKPGQSSDGNELTVYRPRVEKAKDSEKPRPRQVVTYDEAKAMKEKQVDQPLEPLGGVDRRETGDQRGYQDRTKETHREPNVNPSRRGSYSNDTKEGKMQERNNRLDEPTQRSIPPRNKDLYEPRRDEPIQEDQRKIERQPDRPLDEPSRRRYNRRPMAPPDRVQDEDPARLRNSNDTSP